MIDQVLQTVNNATSEFGQSFAGRDYSAPTADQPQMSMPEDAGPFGSLGAIGQTIGDFGRGLAQEGLSGLLDPMGMLDRQDAQRELATQFNVMSPEDMVCRPGEPDPVVAGNTVTPEEFQRIARTYSDIRTGRSDIQLNTSGMSDEDAARFRSETMGDIGNLLQTESGRELVNGLAYQPDDHTTTLNLRTDASGNRDNSNARGGAAPGSTAGSWADGTGTNAQVTYVPGDDGGIVAPGFNDAWLPMRSDVTLFHEMTHAYHAAYGTLDQSTLSTSAGGEHGHPDDHGQAGLEYQAVGLGGYSSTNMTENRYRAERREIGRSNIGERTTGGVSDDDMVHRTSYVGHRPPAAAP